MKKTTLPFLFCLLSYFVSAQSYVGFLSDNYSGVHGVIFNPSNIVDSRFKTDINLAGASIFASNNYFGINVLDATKDGYSFDMESNKYPEDDNRAIINADIFGPAFMFNLSNRSSLAIFTRARFFTNINKVKGETMASIDDDTTKDVNINNENFNALGHGWAEFGITYARVLLNKNQHFIKGGASLKYLQGLASAYASGENVSLFYDYDGTDLGGGQTTGSITTSGKLNYSRFDNFDDTNYDYKVPKKSNGVSGDIGFIYEWRPEYANYQTADTLGKGYAYKDKNKYKLKIGISITDIGYIDYKEGIKEGYNIAANDISEVEYESYNNLADFFDSTYLLSDSRKGYMVDLPTAMHFNLDWSLNSKIYLNFNTDFSLISRNRVTANRISNIASVTLRYESKWFSFYLPFSLVESNGFRMGAGLRAGPLYIGSGSVISAFTRDDNKGADVYAGLKIPIYQGNQKDIDGDGIPNKLDECPEQAGPVENNGCPWKDSDDDGLLDNVDECPEQAGPEENRGCPWGDLDGDLIKDNIDACPELFGPEANNGCPYPDSDGDGVLDKDDICIDEVGTVANKGCPEEVIQKMQTSLNDYAKVILFDHGKSTIRDESEEVLTEIIAILNTYPNAKFMIEGHTDSIGSYELNQWLSDERANAVKDYLVEHGIDSTRLTAIGYGERRPIATNMYKPGRAKNRRVEINLIK